MPAQAPNISPCHERSGRVPCQLLEPLGALVVWRVRGAPVDTAGALCVQPGTGEGRSGLQCIEIISVLLSPGRGAVRGQMVFLSDLVALSGSSAAE